MRYWRTLAEVLEQAIVLTLESAAAAGREALDTLTNYDAAVVVLDIGMPGMDGYEVALAIRERDQGRRRMLVALTGWGQEGDRLRALQARF